MNSMRRRKVLLVLMILTENGRGVAELWKNKVESLIALPVFQAHNKITDKFEQTVPIHKDRLAEINRAKKLVNGAVPMGYTSWRPDVRLWMAGVVAQRMVAEAFFVTEDPTEIEYLAALIGMIENFTPNPVPGPLTLASIQEFPARMYAAGLVDRGNPA